jgi:hypothetical protein
VEYAIEKPSNKLLAATDPDSDTWVAEVKRIHGKKQPLTAAGVQGLRGRIIESRPEPGRCLRRCSSRAGIKPQGQSLFGIGYGFLFGIACAGAPGQVWKHGRPAPSLRVVLKQHSKLHDGIIPLANLADNHNAARFRCPIEITSCQH